MKTFQGYRINPPKHYVENGLSNGPFEPDYEGVVFEDGVTVIHWLTTKDDINIETFTKFATFEKIHGHPEYGTQIVWGEEVFTSSPGLK